MQTRNPRSRGLMFEIILKHPIRTSLAWLGMAAALSCSSENDATEPEPVTITLQILPTSISIAQGGAATFTVTVTRSGDFTGTVYLAVTGAPAGVTGIVSDVRTTGPVTTATIRIDVDGASTPGNYDLGVRGDAVGVAPATAQLSLVVAEVLLPCPVTGLCEQWAAGATASSEQTSTEWSASQATGQPNVIGCADHANAWASKDANGVDWLELAYQESVRPTEIQVYETYGVSSIVQVEVGEGTGTYHTVYTALPVRLSCPRILIIPVTNLSTAIKVIRLSIDQRTLDDWNEIDAVKLIGNR